MNKKIRAFCPCCGNKIIQKEEDQILRDFCACCELFFYDNPLPVVSAIVVSDRKILLVKRGKKPYKGMWCLPTGFAESGESIEQAALRELAEETGLTGSIVSHVDVDSGLNYFYGDLIFLTFEVEPSGGKISPGGDTVAVKYFSIEHLPRLAFPANTKAVQAYIKSKSEYWSILDSFSQSLEKRPAHRKKINLLSDQLVTLIEANANTITQTWLSDVTTNRSTPGYHHFDRQELFQRNARILSQLRKWLGGTYTDRDIREHYMALGLERKREGFNLSDILSGLSLMQKHIWEFARSRGGWKPIDIYMVLELERRIVIFFDKAAFYSARGYEQDQPEPVSGKPS